MLPLYLTVPPRWLTSGTLSFVLVVDCAFKFCFVQTPVLEGFDVVVLRLSTTTVRGSGIFAVGCKAVGFNVDVALGCLVRSFSGVRSICAGLTWSAVTVSILPLINTLNTRPLLATTLYGPL